MRPTDHLAYRALDPGAWDRRGAAPEEDNPLHKGALLMAAPSGLTRFTTSLCVGPLPTPRRVLPNNFHQFNRLEKTAKMIVGMT